MRKPIHIFNHHDKLEKVLALISDSAARYQLFRFVVKLKP
jgi:hypothetical protein